MTAQELVWFALVALALAVRWVRRTFRPPPAGGLAPDACPNLLKQVRSKAGSAALA